ncbi:nuclease-related domain-containing protein [Microbacterium sp.]|uniref:nuclease-related domain-containing protein n=1 Tax=Microbacterium sp. TaxID=51671 RepID=UPI0027331B3D|nr:nuclease-related domain-containing protein [Microbacterium sp.]MDP3949515.1 nuclease-related domain-containing protein [Microbacterium sp.]
MRLRYTGVCHRCGAELPAGQPAVYERAVRRVRCISCPVSSTASRDTGPVTPAEIASGSAGASARREYERRRDSRETRIRQKHPKLGGLILALSDEPQSTRAWEHGAIGEELLAIRLRGLPEPAHVLNDRRIPGARANIDHIVIAPSGVWVVDAKRYKNKRPELRVDGGIIRPRVESLRIGGRDGTKLVDGVHKQVAVVRAALEGTGVPVHGVLCFLEADWPMIGGSFTVDDLHVLWPRLLVKRINDAQQHDLDVDAVHAQIAETFPIA